MQRLRIFVGDMPRLLRDIVEEIVQSQPDMELTSSHGDAGLFDAPHQADVVIVGEPADSGLTIATMTNDERGAHLVESRRLLTVELSPQILLEAVRGAACKTH